MARIQYPYIWLFCAFASLGAFLYGYDGVYFNGVQTLGMPIFLRRAESSAFLTSMLQTHSSDTSVNARQMANMPSLPADCHS